MKAIFYVILLSLSMNVFAQTFLCTTADSKQTATFDVIANDLGESEVQGLLVGGSEANSKAYFEDYLDESILTYLEKEVDVAAAVQLEDEEFTRLTLFIFAFDISSNDVLGVKDQFNCKVAE